MLFWENCTSHSFLAAISSIQGRLITVMKRLKNHKHDRTGMKTSKKNENTSRKVARKAKQDSRRNTLNLQPPYHGTFLLLHGTHQLPF